MTPREAEPRARSERVAGFRSIRVRIAVAFAAALLAMFFAQAWLIAQQQSVATSLELVANGYLPLSKQVARIRRDQDRVQRDLQRLSRDRPRPVTGDNSAAEIYTDELRENLEIARILARGMRARAVRAEEQAVLAKTVAYLDAVEGHFARYEEQSRRYLEAVARGLPDDEKEALRRPLRAIGGQLADEFDKLEKTLDGRITALTRETEQLQARATQVAISVTLGATGASMALLVASLVALQPIGRLTEQVQRVAAGATGARVEVGGRTEVGLLAREFNAMAEAIEQRDRSLTERAEELRRLSRYLGSVLDGLDDGLVVVEHGLVTLANPAAKATWGARPGEPPPDALCAVLEPGQHRIDGPEGTRHDVRAVAFGEGGVVAVIADVTAQLRDQERLARSERLALVGQMLAQITHEVRNPLNALSLNAELLGDEIARLDPEGTTEARTLLARIAGEVDRLTAVTGHYLQLARRPRATLAEEDVGRVLDEVARLLHPEVAAAGATLATTVELSEPQLVDGNQLRQAVLNVVRNALEAGAKRLLLDARRRGDELVVSLTDDGPGMTEEEARQATDPFFSTKASGTGLGLAITRQILEDHDGRVEIESTPGSGTVLRLIAPWRPAGALRSA